MVAPARNVLGREFLSANRPRVEALARKGGRTFDPDALWFPAGSMFWTRPEVLLPLADLGLTAEDFGPETGQSTARWPTRSSATSASWRRPRDSR